jgi:hypothetical protein
MQNMVNSQKYLNESICHSVAYILGKDSECPDPLYPTSLGPSFPQKYPQVSWKSLTVLGMAI